MTGSPILPTQDQTGQLACAASYAGQEKAGAHRRVRGQLTPYVRVISKQPYDQVHTADTSPSIQIGTTWPNPDSNSLSGLACPWLSYSKTFDLQVLALYLPSVSCGNKPQALLYSTFASLSGGCKGFVLAKHIFRIMLSVCYDFGNHCRIDGVSFDGVHGQSDLSVLEIKN